MTREQIRNGIYKIYDILFIGLFVVNLIVTVIVFYSLYNQYSHLVESISGINTSNNITEQQNIFTL